MGDKTIGDRIRKLRRERGWNQDDLAQAAGISKATVVSAERGNHMLKPHTIKKLSTGLGITTQELTRAQPEDKGFDVANMTPHEAFMLGLQLSRKDN